MDKAAFEQLVLAALEELPPKFWRKMENIAVTVEDEPSAEILTKQGLKPPDTLLGLYEGVPRTKRGIYYANVLPDKITIFKKPIESVCHNNIELKNKIKEVVIHEVGHYFGLSEEELME
jgi:predicted Zn-dependent protease with MMP-like domain